MCQAYLDAAISIYKIQLNTRYVLIIAINVKPYFTGVVSPHKALPHQVTVYNNETKGRLFSRVLFLEVDDVDLSAGDCDDDSGWW